MNKLLTADDIESTAPSVSVLDCLKLRFKSEVGEFIVLCVFAAFFAAMGIAFLINHMYSFAGECLLYLVILAAVPFIEYAANITLPPALTVAGMGIALGAVLGEACNFYYIFPHFDEILHTTSGFVFACFGMCLVKKLVSGEESTAKFFGMVGFAIAFSLAVALIWELFELGGSVTVGIDMEEDTLINKISTYYFTQDRSDITVIQNITQTVIYYGDGETLVIENGYLDIGFYDTLFDMLVCFIGAIVFGLAMLLDRKFFKGRVRRWFVPEETYPFKPQKSARIKN